MKRKILSLGVSFLLVAALVLTSCGEAVPGEQEEEEEEEEVTPVGEQEEEEEEEEEEQVEVAVGEPQYGGTLTRLWSAFRNPTSWDPYDGGWGMLPYWSPTLETMMVGDYEKYGPRGTNEWAFTLTQHIPDEFLKGQLTESWEITTDPLGVLFHIRPGCMFYDNDHIGFEAREYTAEDAAVSVNRYRASSPGSRWMGYVKADGAYAVDKYTLQVPFDRPAAGWTRTMAYCDLTHHYAPESVEAPGGAADWRNLVGTGPFILTEVVRGSHVSYRKNPDWWDKEKIIDGKKYDVPFIDKLIYPIIVDESTLIAAVRTGRGDMAHHIHPRYRDSLAGTSPDLILYDFLQGHAGVVEWTVTSGLFANRDLRRAMFIGTDCETIGKAIYTKSAPGGHPYCSAMTDYFTPIVDLPPSAKELFTYDPEKAAQMIVDAGYPNGLTVELNFDPTTVIGEAASMLEDQWSKIGVTTIMNSADTATLSTMLARGTWTDAIIRNYGVTSAFPHLDGWRSISWKIMYDDEWFNEELDKTATLGIDPAEQNAMFTELGEYLIDSATLIQLGQPYVLGAYWPWVKNYYGEVSGGADLCGYLATLWIDQDLKEEMGY